MFQFRKLTEKLMIEYTRNWCDFPVITKSVKTNQINAANLESMNVYITWIASIRWNN